MQSLASLVNWAASEWHALDSDGQPGEAPLHDFQQLGHRRALMSTRVVGVGVGVFVLFFFLALSLAICLIGSRTKYRAAIAFASTAMLGIVALVLLASPKGERPPKPPYGYDRTIVGMVVIMAALCLGVLGAVVGLLVFHVLPPNYNRPLSYHLDIMQRRD